MKHFNPVFEPAGLASNHFQWTYTSVRPTALRRNLNAEYQIYPLKIPGVINNENLISKLFLAVLGHNTAVSDFEGNIILWITLRNVCQVKWFFGDKLTLCNILSLIYERKEWKRKLLGSRLMGYPSCPMCCFSIPFTVVVRTNEIDFTCG